MRLDLAFVDLDHRPQCLRLASCFGWLHHPSVLRGLTPPACTNLHSSNSIQMCERNPTLSGRLNMLVHEYAQDKLKGPILATDGDTDDRLNDTVKKHYVRLAE